MTRKHLSLVLGLLISLGPMVIASAATHEVDPPARNLVHADGHPIALWARVPIHPRHVILLVHGRTWSALPDFDLRAPHVERSIMRELAARGYATYAIDLRGYGATSRDSSGWLTPSRAAADVAASLAWIAARHPDLAKPALLGWSRGSLVAQLAAQQHPQSLSDLILYGYPRGSAKPPAEPPSPDRPLREINTRERALSDFISPQVVSPALVDAYVAAALQADPIRVDWRAMEEFNELDAARVSNPTLLIHGERDTLTPLDAQAAVFTKLANPDRQWVIIAGGDHAAMLEDTQPAFIAAITAFIERPQLDAAKRASTR